MQLNERATRAGKGRDRHRPADTVSWFLLAALLVTLASSCGRHPDVQLQVISFRASFGVHCRGWESCFVVVVRNVGTERGSGHCEVPYLGRLAPDLNAPRLYVRVKDLAPGAVYTQVSPRTMQELAAHGSYTCDPGVRNATP
jgi:hypothetical protein